MACHFRARGNGSPNGIEGVCVIRLLLREE